MKQEKSDHPVH